VEDRQHAEDIATDVFVKLIDSLGTFSGPRRSLRGWLFKVARNEINRHYGKSKQLSTTALEDWQDVPDFENDDLETAFIRSMTLEQIRSALKMLGPEQQEVLILRFAEGFDIQTTGSVMGKSVSAVKSLQFRAVGTLRRIMGEMRHV